MAHFGQVWIYYAVVGGGMGTSSECASFFVPILTEKEFPHGRVYLKMSALQRRITSPG